MEPTILTDHRSWLGENPLWHPGEACLYWTDAGTGEILRYDPESDAVECVYEGERVGGFTVQGDGSLLLFGFDRAVELAADGTARTVLESVPEGGRFNDVIADPRGRVFCGVMHDDGRPGALYRLDRDGTVDRVVPDVLASNGLGFSPDREYLYYTDTNAYEIYRFSYDETTGRLSDRELFARVAEDGPGKPDGMVVDGTGDVWSARWNGYCLVRYRPDGSERARYDFPVRKVTSLTFGGPDYGTAYVTTARRNTDSAQLDPEPEAGATFGLEPAVDGFEPFRSRIGLE